MSERKLRILIVHNYYQIGGGEDTVMANEKKMLEEHGHTVITYTRNNRELSDLSAGQKLLLPVNTIFNRKTYRDIKRIIREQKIDIVHVHNTLNLISASVYYAALKCKKPIVQTIHNYRLLCPSAIFYHDGHVCEDCLKQGLHCAVRHKCYRGSRIQTLACVIALKIHRFTGIYGKINYICLTEFNKEKLLSLKQIKEDRVYVRPNFTGSWEKVIPYEQRKKQFVYVGRIEEIKGIKVLLQAWEQMGDKAPKLLLCGTGPLEEWCKKFISEHKMNRIEMTGRIPNQQVRQILSESLGLILPTQLYEGFPMTIIEAYSVGTPVIGSGIGNTGNIVKEGITGWKFQPDSPGELVEAVGKVHDVVNQVIEEYRTKYTEEESYKELMDIYDSVLKSSKM